MARRRGGGRGGAGGSRGRLQDGWPGPARPSALPELAANRAESSRAQPRQSTRAERSRQHDQAEQPAGSADGHQHGYRRHLTRRRNAPPLRWQWQLTLFVGDSFSPWHDVTRGAGTWTGRLTSLSDHHCVITALPWVRPLHNTLYHFTRCTVLHCTAMHSHTNTHTHTSGLILGYHSYDVALKAKALRGQPASTEGFPCQGRGVAAAESSSSLGTRLRLQSRHLLSTTAHSPARLSRRQGAGAGVFQGVALALHTTGPVRALSPRPNQHGSQNSPCFNE